MTFSRKLFVIAMLLSPLLCAQQQTPQGAEFRVALLSPIDTSVNHNGDRVVTRVLTPEQYRGDIVEGEIIESLQRVFGTYTETPVF